MDIDPFSELPIMDDDHPSIPVPPTAAVALGYASGTIAGAIAGAEAVSSLSKSKKRRVGRAIKGVIDCMAVLTCIKGSKDACKEGMDYAEEYLEKEGKKEGGGKASGV